MVAFFISDLVHKNKRHSLGLFSFHKTFKSLELCYHASIRIESCQNSMNILPYSFDQKNTLKNNVLPIIKAGKNKAI